MGNKVMLMRGKLVWFSGLICALMLSAGCSDNSTSSQQGSVAVIDLDKVATAIGRDEAIAARVAVYTRRQEESLNQLRDELRTELASKQEGLGEAPSDEDKQSLARLAVQAETRLKQQIAAAEQFAGRLRIDLVLDFKNEVQPVARRIAQQRGMDVVLVKENAMLYINPLADITDAVIDELQSLNTVRQSNSTLPTAAAAGEALSSPAPEKGAAEG